MAGQTALKGKKGRLDVRDEQINRLKKKVGDWRTNNAWFATQYKTRRLIYEADSAVLKIRRNGKYY